MTAKLESQSIAKLPARPRRVSPDRQLEANYYVKTQAAALVQKYKGRGKGLEIFLSEDEYQRLETLKILFGPGFTINNVICATAYYSTSKHGISKFFIKEPNQFARDHIIQIKPTEESMIAILLCGRENGATWLTKTGIDILYNRLTL